MKKGRIWLFGGLLLLLFIGKRLSELGAFYESRFPFPKDSLAYIPGIPGPEDMEIDIHREGIWVSSGHHCSGQASRPPRGDIYFLDYRDGKASPKAMHVQKPDDFNPHGISLWADSLDAHRLFAVNHRADGSQSIEVFQILDGPRLVHHASLRSSSLSWPNDVLAVGPDAALVTVVSKYGKGWGKQMDAFLNLHGGFVLYIDPEQSYTAVGGLGFPNGILQGKDSKEVYVAETIAGSVRVLGLQVDKRLKEKRKQFIHYGLDNLAWDAEGKLWIAAPSNMLALAGHIAQTDKPSPAVIFQVDTQAKAWKIRMVYQDPGEVQPGISVALPYRGHLHLGAFCQSQILTLPYPATMP